MVGVRGNWEPGGYRPYRTQCAGGRSPYGIPLSGGACRFRVLGRSFSAKVWNSAGRHRSSGSSLDNRPRRSTGMSTVHTPASVTGVGRRCPVPRGRRVIAGPVAAAGVAVANPRSHQYGRVRCTRCRSGTGRVVDRRAAAPGIVIHQCGGVVVEALPCKNSSTVLGEPHRAADVEGIRFSGRRQYGRHLGPAPPPLPPVRVGQYRSPPRRRRTYPPSDTSARSPRRFRPS
ncbi:hypothetical protein H4W31_000332 [Plantactinospora soyae]|uniref:Uncharacterized protein n=1 Tax=Plantactinospora soyae TaxID=1544732 RepID=A0A927R2M5_9ACTN|nr:hypothetical protein [Plantactinospora soyae]